MDITGFDFNPMAQKIVNICRRKTQNNNEMFFHIQVAYFLGKIASLMGTKVESPLLGTLPVNVYAINLAPSGFGKNLSTNIIERGILGDFKKTFMGKTYKASADVTLDNIAAERSTNTGEPIAEILANLKNEFRKAGHFSYSFDEATAPAIKQARHRILLSGCGALNLEIDEIGLNINRSVEALTSYLELYDAGLIKPKLTKNTNDSIRDEEIDGCTPSNMLMFGTPAYLLNGSEEENLFMSLLETGYARRSFFGYADLSDIEPVSEDTPIEQVYRELTATKHDGEIDTLRYFFKDLADASMLGRTIPIPQDVDIEILRYQQHCRKRAEDISVYEEIRKSEMTHRYFKAMKLAGAYAFIDKSPEMTIDHLQAAIHLTEEAGKCFDAIMKRDKPHVRLAKYIAYCDRDLTNADLIEKLPFFKRASVAIKKELLSLARAYGYSNNIIIKQFMQEGIDFYRGETLEPTNLDELIISYSTDSTQHYTNDLAPLNQLDQLCCQSNMFFLNHHLKNGDDGNGYRQMDNCIDGFNTIILDPDDTSLSPYAASQLLKEYKHFIYTTKSNTQDGLYSYRIVLPMNYVLKLDNEDFAEFMDNVYAALPFDVDTKTKDRARRWATVGGAATILNEDGELFDILPLIPKTSRNVEFADHMKSLGDFNNVERWFAQRTMNGNRNQMMLKFALMLVDTGTMELDEVREAVYSFNSKLKPSLTKDEINRSIMVTVANRYIK